MDLRTREDCVIVRPDKPIHEFLILPPGERSGTGVILVAGPTCKDLKVGDNILFGEFIGQELKYQGEDLLIMREEHVLGVKNEA